MQTFSGCSTLKYHLSFTKACNSGSELTLFLCSLAREDQYFRFLCLKPPPSDRVERSKQQKEKKKKKRKKKTAQKAIISVSCFFF